MPEDLESLLSQLEPEPTPEIDWEAPESGQFPPQVYPGRHRFTFHLYADKPFDLMELDGHKYLRVNFEAAIPVDGNADYRVRFQRAANNIVKGRTNSDLVELIRCLGLRPDGNGDRALATCLIQADGRAAGEAVFGWDAYAKDTQEVISTNPQRKARKKSGKVDIPWPKGADGKYTAVVKFPESGDSVYGRERIVSYKLPSRDGLPEGGAA